jgi:hypothetical protein
MHDPDAGRRIQQLSQGVGRAERHAAGKFHLGAVAQQAQLVSGSVVLAAGEDGTLEQHRPDHGREVHDGT